MLTRCPQCATTFRVSPQQLKVHRGEVRCGRCSAIFDAFESLVAEAPATATAERPPAPVADASTATAEPANESSEGKAQARPELRWAAPDYVPPPTPVPATGALADKPVPARRRQWAALVVAASLGLGAQALYFYRSALAEVWPDSRPALQRACAELHCRVLLPQHEDLLSVRASNLQVDTGRANLMLLTATLKNRAPFAQEYPALALTLNDMQNQPLARRVLLPAEYLDRRVDANAGFASDAELEVAVYVETHDLKTTGYYRLMLFYP